TPVITIGVLVEVAFAAIETLAGLIVAMLASALERATSNFWGAGFASVTEAETVPPVPPTSLNAGARVRVRLVTVSVAVPFWKLLANAVITAEPGCAEAVNENVALFFPTGISTDVGKPP